MTQRKVLIMIDEGVEDVELFVDGEKIGLNEFVVEILSGARWIPETILATSLFGPPPIEQVRFF